MDDSGHRRYDLGKAFLTCSGPDRMGYAVVKQDEVPAELMSEYYSDYVERNERKKERYLEADEKRPSVDVRVRPIGEVLNSEQMNVQLWTFQEGDEIEYHAHSTQEEVYYILEGRFSLKLGPTGDTEIVEVGSGTFYVAGAKTGHGHRCIEAPGTVLAIGAPPADDPGLDPHKLD